MSILINQRQAKPFLFWEDFFDNGRFFEESSSKERTLAIDLSSDEGVVNVRAELPGLSKKDIQIEYDDGLLTITATKAEQKLSESSKYHLRELSTGTLVRRIQVGDIDFQKSQAVYNEGVLTLRLPKSGQSSPKRLEIK